jgi:hypothetical protein
MIKGNIRIFLLLLAAKYGGKLGRKQPTANSNSQLPATTGWLLAFNSLIPVARRDGICNTGSMIEGQAQSPWRWWLGVVALAGLVVGMGAAGYWMAINRSLPLKEAVETQPAGGPRADYKPSYVIESKIPGIQVRPVAKATELIESWWDQYGAGKPRVFGAWLPEGHQELQPKELAFVYYPLESLTEAGKGDLLFGVSTGGELLAGTRHRYDNHRLEYQI